VTGYVEWSPRCHASVRAAVLVLLVALFGSSVKAQGSSTPEKEALAAVQKLFDAMHAKDTAAVRATFEPGARVIGIRTDSAGTHTSRALSVNEFVAFVGRDTRAPWTERAWNPEVRVSGPLATVWTEYDFHFGNTFSHCGIDAVQLLRSGDGWKIVSLAYTNTPAGCTRHPPPEK
jgi:hypothetical protein